MDPWYLTYTQLSFCFWYKSLSTSGELIVMEFVENGSLISYLRKMKDKNRKDPAKLLKFGRDVSRVKIDWNIFKMLNLLTPYLSFRKNTRYCHQPGVSIVVIRLKFYIELNCLPVFKQTTIVIVIKLHKQIHILSNNQSIQLK